MLTDKEIAERMVKGIHCWDCKSRNVSASLLDAKITAWTAYIPMECDDCGAKWDERFRLEGYVNLKL